MPAPEAAPAVEAKTSLAEDPAIVERIQQDLDAAGEIETPEPESTGTPPPAVEGEEKPAEEVAEPKTSEEPAAAPAAKPETSTLPASYRRSAKARGWEDKEIDDFVASNPDKALQTFERIHSSRVEEVNQWAKIGREHRQGTPAREAGPAPAAPVAADPMSALKPVDVKALAEQFGNEDLLTAMAGPLNAAIAAIQPLMARAKQYEEQEQRSARETLGKQVQNFFTSKELQPFSEAYGGDPASLTDAQLQMRAKVLETADSLIAGARFQGRELSTEEALTYAHDAVSSGLKEKVIRETLKTAVTKRAKGITLKPTNRGSTDQGGPPRDRKELENRTSDRLRGIFG